MAIIAASRPENRSSDFVELSYVSFVVLLDWMASMYIGLPELHVLRGNWRRLLPYDSIASQLSSSFVAGQQFGGELVLEKVLVGPIILGNPWGEVGSTGEKRVEAPTRKAHEMDVGWSMSIEGGASVVWTRNPLATNVEETWVTR